LRSERYDLAVGQRSHHSAFAGANVILSGTCSSSAGFVVSISKHRQFAWSTSFRALLPSQSRASDLITTRP